MYKIVITQQGARKLGKPELMGETAYYEKCYQNRVGEVYYGGRKLADYLVYDYDDPDADCRLVTFPIKYDE
jgi:hypothetical protein